MYFPAGTFTASAAGFYYVTMTSTTVGTVYSNLYVSGIPTIPASPALVTTGAGAYVQTTGAAVDALSIPVPGGTLGANGAIEIDCLVSNINNANNKTIVVKYSSAPILSLALTATLTFNAIGKIVNVGVIGRQIAFVSTALGTSVNATTQYSIDSGINQNIIATLQLAVDTDYMVLQRVGIRLIKS